MSKDKKDLSSFMEKLTFDLVWIVFSMKWSVASLKPNDNVSSSPIFCKYIENLLFLCRICSFSPFRSSTLARSLVFFLNTVIVYMAFKSRPAYECPPGIELICYACIFIYKSLPFHFVDKQNAFERRGCVFFLLIDTMQMPET